jgi:hypothetical protein
MSDFISRIHGFAWLEGGEFMARGYYGGIAFS